MGLPCLRLEYPSDDVDANASKSDSSIRWTKQYPTTFFGYTILRNTLFGVDQIVNNTANIWHERQLRHSNAMSYVRYSHLHMYNYCHT